MTRAELLRASRRELRELLETGHPIDPDQLSGTFRGISLGLPAWVERLTWKKFAKVFERDAQTGEVRGYNMRVEQDGLERPWTPRLRGGVPWTFGPFAVTRERDRVWLDYGAVGRRSNERASAVRSLARTGPLGLLRDPLVALRAGSVELLLGRSDVALGAARVPTPSYFLLES